MLKDTPAVSFNDLYRQINACDSKTGITQIDILALTPPLDIIFNTISRENCLTAAEFAIEFDLSEIETMQLINMLIDKGYLVACQTNNTETAYKINYTRSKPRKLKTDIWDTLDF